MDPLDTLEVARRRGGSHWLDLIVGGSAIIIAFISLAIAIKQSTIMERQLAASNWPYLQFGTSNEGDEGKAIISLDVENAGVGPARVHNLSLLYDGKPLASAGELIDACCADLRAEGLPNWSTSTLHGQVLSPNRTLHLFVLSPGPKNVEYWKRLNVARNKLVLRACYCSVLDQCWMFDSSQSEPAPITSCPAAQPQDYDG
jgi:hypothetical protein